MDNSETKVISKLNDREKKQAALPIAVFGMEMVMEILNACELDRSVIKIKIYFSGREILFETIHGQGRGADAIERRIKDL